MSLSFNSDDVKACTKPYELTLNDCLACSGCISNSDLNALNKSIDLSLLTDQYTFFISPYSKINLYNEVAEILRQRIMPVDEQTPKSNGRNSNQTTSFTCNVLDFSTFEDMLLRFVKSKFGHELVDVSHAYKTMYKLAFDSLNDKMIITSSCPGVVAYIERKGQPLVENLFKCKSPQQILAIKYKMKSIVSIVTCYDKKLEESAIKYTISSAEYLNFLINNGFIDFLEKELDVNTIENGDANIKGIVCHKNALQQCNDNAKTIEICNDMHKICKVNEKYIEYFLSVLQPDNTEIEELNDNFFVYTCKVKEKMYKFARIYGLTNFLNFVNKAKKGVHAYNFVEAFICEYSCINGPVQVKNKLDADLIYMQSMELNNKVCMPNTNSSPDNHHFEDMERNFVAHKQNKKEYKIEW